MASEWALAKAAQAWTTPENEKTEMDVNLATTFADILDEATQKPTIETATKARR